MKVIHSDREPVKAVASFDRVISLDSKRVFDYINC